MNAKQKLNVNYNVTTNEFLFCFWFFYIYKCKCKCKQPTTQLNKTRDQNTIPEHAELVVYFKQCFFRQKQVEQVSDSFPNAT